MAGAHDVPTQDLNVQVAQSTADRGKKAEFQAQTLQSKADVQGDLKDTISTRDADTKYLSDLSATCEQKAMKTAMKSKAAAPAPAMKAKRYWRDEAPKYVDSSDGEEYPFNLRNPRVYYMDGEGWVLPETASDAESEQNWLNKKDQEYG